MKDPTATEMRAFLNTAPFTDEFSREEAIYWFANDYHEGQGSNLYSALCCSEFRPSPLARGPEELDLYDYLEKEFAR